ncbi:hypothetical protein [Spirosoma montaniterrae]|uniref:Uncharacterized protein n=1 Tax=Spirosoma montaniterrae TaxID=1178516 RepID=A0A1P9WU31_9BACT|nr:hypothetical protein [Spirosoma montaniterrae]AQG78884.1 hypothetical protein AWR27_05820 [Spirosoma montaniterrae]
MNLYRPSRQLLPVDNAVAQQINTLIADASRGYGGRVARLEVLRTAWSVAVQYRERTGANDVVSVCTEHYLYARYRSAEGAYGEFEQSVLIFVYPFYKTAMPVYAGQRPPSLYDFLHSYWELKGVRAGHDDRAHSLEPIARITP